MKNNKNKNNSWYKEQNNNQWNTPKGHQKPQTTGEKESAMGRYIREEEQKSKQ